MTKQSPIKQFVSNAFADGVRKTLPTSWAERFGIAEGLQVCMERPLQGEMLGTTIEVQGWVIAPRRRKLEGELLLNNSTIVPLFISERREDVATAFQIGDAHQAYGFKHRLVRSQYADADGSVQLSLRFSDGVQTQYLGPYTFSQRLPLTTVTCCLESPLAGQCFASEIEIAGWVIAPAGQSVEGRILAFGCEVSRFAVFEPREDVAAAYHLSNEEAALGFSERLPWSTFLSGQGEVDLSFELCHRDGVVRLGPFSVAKSASPLPRHSRGSYKEVWNAASEDPTDAMLAVAGIADYSEFMETGVCSATTIRETLDIEPADDVLEIGCGTGRIGKALASDCRHWVGADISGQMLAHARENLAGLENITLVELNSATLNEFADGIFDKVYCSAVFMHLEEWDRYRYVTEAFRVLRPGGKCYFDNMNLAGENAWSVFSQLSKLDPLTRLPQISKTSTGEEIEVYLKNAGFCDISVRREPLLVTVWGRKPM